jgi:hypothetical protein
MLGNYHDLHVIGEQLHEWQADSSLAQGTAILEVLSKRCAACAEELKVQFPELYGPLSGRYWKRLRRAMKG